MTFGLHEPEFEKNGEISRRFDVSLETYGFQGEARLYPGSTSELGNFVVIRELPYDDDKRMYILKKSSPEIIINDANLMELLKEAVGAL